MKRISYFIILLLLALSFTGCHKTKKEDESAKHPDSLAKGHEGDSVEKFTFNPKTGSLQPADSGKGNKNTPQKNDSTGKGSATTQIQSQMGNATTKVSNSTNGKQASGQGSSSQTADQSVFDVKGPVKCINYTQGFLASYNQIVPIIESRDIVNFDSKGRWIPTSRYVVKRDKNNRIVSVTRIKDKITNEYTWNGNAMKTVKVYAQSKKDEYSVATIGRGKDNLVKGYTASINFKGDNGRENVKIKILQRDKYGNWTRRVFRTNQETRVEDRVIEYRN